jgi:hypothetical protein
VERVSLGDMQAGLLAKFEELTLRDRRSHTSRRFQSARPRLNLLGHTLSGIAGAPTRTLPGEAAIA